MLIHCKSSGELYLNFGCFRIRDWYIRIRKELILTFIKFLLKHNFLNLESNQTKPL